MNKSQNTVFLKDCCFLPNYISVGKNKILEFHNFERDNIHTLEFKHQSSKSKVIKLNPGAVGSHRFQTTGRFEIISKSFGITLIVEVLENDTENEIMNTNNNKDENLDKSFVRPTPKLNYNNTSSGVEKNQDEEVKSMSKQQYQQLTHYQSDEDLDEDDASKNLEDQRLLWKKTNNNNQMLDESYIDYEYSDVDNDDFQEYRKAHKLKSQASLQSHMRASHQSKGSMKKRQYYNNNNYYNNNDNDEDMEYDDDNISFNTSTNGSVDTDAHSDYDGHSHQELNTPPDSPPRYAHAHLSNKSDSRNNSINAVSDAMLSPPRLRKRKVIVLEDYDFKPRDIVIFVNTPIEFRLASTVKGHVEHALVGKSNAEKLCFEGPLMSRTGDVDTYLITPSVPGELFVKCSIYSDARLKITVLPDTNLDRINNIDVDGYDGWFSHSKALLQSPTRVSHASIEIHSPLRQNKKNTPPLHGSFLPSDATGIFSKSPDNCRNNHQNHFNNSHNNNSVTNSPHTPTSGSIMRSDPVNIANSYHSYISSYGYNSRGDREGAVNTTPGMSSRVLPSYIGSNCSVGSLDIYSDGHSSQSQLDSDDGSSLDMDGESDPDHHHSHGANSNQYHYYNHANPMISSYAVSNRSLNNDHQDSNSYNINGTNNNHNMHDIMVPLYSSLENEVNSLNVSLDDDVKCNVRIQSIIAEDHNFRPVNVDISCGTLVRIARSSRSSGNTVLVCNKIADVVVKDSNSSSNSSSSSSSSSNGNTTSSPLSTTSSANNVVFESITLDASNTYHDYLFDEEGHFELLNEVFGFMKCTINVARDDKLDIFNDFTDATASINDDPRKNQTTNTTNTYVDNNTHACPSSPTSAPSLRGSFRQFPEAGNTYGKYCNASTIRNSSDDILDHENDANNDDDSYSSTSSSGIGSDSGIGAEYIGNGQTYDDILGYTPSSSRNKSSNTTLSNHVEHTTSPHFPYPIEAPPPYSLFNRHLKPSIQSPEECIEKSADYSVEFSDDDDDKEEGDNGDGDDDNGDGDGDDDGDEKNDVYANVRKLKMNMSDDRFSGNSTPQQVHKMGAVDAVTVLQSLAMLKATDRNNQEIKENTVSKDDDSHFKTGVALGEVVPTHQDVNVDGKEADMINDCTETRDSVDAVDGRRSKAQKKRDRKKRLKQAMIDGTLTFTSPSKTTLSLSGKNTVSYAASEEREEEKDQIQTSKVSSLSCSSSASILSSPASNPNPSSPASSTKFTATTVGDSDKCTKNQKPKVESKGKGEGIEKERREHDRALLESKKQRLAELHQRRLRSDAALRATVLGPTFVTAPSTSSVSSASASSSTTNNCTSSISSVGPVSSPNMKQDTVKTISSVTPDEAAITTTTTNDANAATSTPTSASDYASIASTVAISQHPPANASLPNKGVRSVKDLLQERLSFSDKKKKKEKKKGKEEIKINNDNNEVDLRALNKLQADQNSSDVLLDKELRKQKKQKQKKEQDRKNTLPETEADANVSNKSRSNSNPETEMDVDVVDVVDVNVSSRLSKEPKVTLSSVNSASSTPIKNRGDATTSISTIIPSESNVPCSSTSPFATVTTSTTHLSKSSQKKNKKKQREEKKGLGLGLKDVEKEKDKDKKIVNADVDANTMTGSEIKSNLSASDTMDNHSSPSKMLIATTTTKSDVQSKLPNIQFGKFPSFGKNEDNDYENIKANYALKMNRKEQEQEQGQQGDLEQEKVDVVALSTEKVKNKTSKRNKSKKEKSNMNNNNETIAMETEMMESQMSEVEFKLYSRWLHLEQCVQNKMGDSLPSGGPIGITCISSEGTYRIHV